MLRGKKSLEKQEWIISFKPNVYVRINVVWIFLLPKAVWFGAALPGLFKLISPLLVLKGLFPMKPVHWSGETEIRHKRKKEHWSPAESKGHSCLDRLREIHPLLSCSPPLCSLDRASVLCCSDHVLLPQSARAFHQWEAPPRNSDNRESSNIQHQLSTPWSVKWLQRGTI